jgi:hypothetical protein
VSLAAPSIVSTSLHDGHRNTRNSGRAPTFGTVRTSLIRFSQCRQMATEVADAMIMAMALSQTKTALDL